MRNLFGAEKKLPSSSPFRSFLEGQFAAARTEKFSRLAHRLKKDGHSQISIERRRQAIQSLYKHANQYAWFHDAVNRGALTSLNLL